VHRICSIKWAEQYNIKEEEGIATLCRTHHTGYQNWSKDIEEYVDSSSSDSSSSSCDKSNKNAKSTKGKKKVSLFGILSKLEKFPRFKLTYYQITIT